MRGTQRPLRSCRSMPQEPAGSLSEAFSPTSRLQAATRYCSRGRRLSPRRIESPFHLSSSVLSSTMTATMVTNPTAIRRAHRGLPARPLSKDMTNLPVSGWQQHQQNHSMASKPAAARPMSSSPADQVHFSGFVRLLASKDEHQRTILVQRALQQAENVSSAISSGRFAADSRPLIVAYNAIHVLSVSAM